MGAKVESIESQCTAMMAFSKAAAEEPGIVSEYCTGAFADELILKTSCTKFLEAVVLLNSPSGCDNVAKMMLVFEQMNSANLSSFVYRFLFVIVLSAIILSVLRKSPNRARNDGLSGASRGVEEGNHHFLRQCITGSRLTRKRRLSAMPCWYSLTKRQIAILLFIICCSILSFGIERMVLLELNE